MGIFGRIAGGIEGVVDLPTIKRRAVSRIHHTITVFADDPVAVDVSRSVIAACPPPGIVKSFPYAQDHVENDPDANAPSDKLGGDDDLIGKAAEILICVHASSPLWTEL